VRTFAEFKESIMTDDLEPLPKTSGWSLFFAMLAVALGGLLLTRAFMVPARQIPRLNDGISNVGQTFPPLEVQGWFNGTAPTQDELQGQVLFVDAWAFWCGPCRQLAPTLKQLHATYAPRGVIFMGLTSMDEETLGYSREFIAGEGIPWVQGYGAAAPLATLQADLIPQVWVVGRDGKIVWDSRSDAPIEEVLDQALATQ